MPPIVFQLFFTLFGYSKYYVFVTRVISQNKRCFPCAQIAPYRRKTPEILDYILYGFDNIIHFILSNIFADTEAQRSVSYIVNSADCQKNMARIERSGCAGTAG